MSREVDPFDAEFEPEDEPEQSLDTIKASLAIVPPTVPFLWKKVPRDSWPFKDFRDEYCNSTLLFTAQQLIERWKGLAEPHLIRAYMEDPKRHHDRRNTQLAKWNQEVVVEPQSSMEDMLAFTNAKRRQSVAQQIEHIEAEIDSRCSIELRNIFNDEGQMITRQLRTPMTEIALSRKRRDLEVFIKLERLLHGEATEIYENRNKNDDSELKMEAFINAELAKNPRFAELLKVAEFGGEIFEGEVIPSPLALEGAKVEKYDPNSQSR